MVDISKKDVRFLSALDAFGKKAKFDSKKLGAPSKNVDDYRKGQPTSDAVYSSLKEVGDTFKEGASEIYADAASILGYKEDAATVSARIMEGAPKKKK
jgi:hypothetical protein